MCVVSAVCAFCHSAKVGTGGPVFTLDDILLPQEERRVNNKTPTRGGDVDREYKYKTDHMELFDNARMPWPPKVHIPTLAHLDQRALEVVVYCNEQFPFDMAFQGAEYMDFNPSLARLVGRDGTTNPWSRGMPTLVGSGQYAYRRAHVDPIDGSVQVKVEQLDGLELLQAIGFDQSYMHGPAASHEVCSSMAGNAFSAFALGPLVIGMLQAVMPIGAAEAASDSGSIGPAGGSDEDTE